MKNCLRSVLIFATLICLPFITNVSAQTEKAISGDGVDIAYTTSGQGEPAIVFIHGWSCDKSYWAEQIKTFLPKYTVVALDLAGHGESGLSRVNYTLDLFGEDVAGVVNKLGLKKVILVGHSMGGAVVIAAANKLKGIVIGLIGADTFQNLGTTMPADQTVQFLKPFKENFVETTKAFVKTMFPATADSNLVKKVANDMASAHPKVAVSAMENMFADDGVAAIKELNVPIISINCDRYPITEEANRKLVKHYEIKMMKGVGHFVMLEDPATFDKLLQESIDELVNDKL